MKKAAWVIDAAHLDVYGKSIGILIDYKRLRNFVERKSGAPVGDAYYFSSVPGRNHAGLNSFHRSLEVEAPRGPGLKVKLYGLKSLVSICECGSKSHLPVQRGVDVAVATRLIDLARHHDQIILSSGDGDLLDAVRYVKTNFNTKIVLASFMHSTSEELMYEADLVIWLDREIHQLAHVA